jgi:hypothetical protein
MNRLIAPAVAGVLLAVSGTAPALAQQAPVPSWPPQSDAPGVNPGALASAALEQLLQALGLALQSLPQYETPAFNERGDIIIRRANPTHRPTQRAPANPDEART